MCALHNRTYFENHNDKVGIFVTTMMVQNKVSFLNAKNHNSIILTLQKYVNKYYDFFVSR